MAAGGKLRSVNNSPKRRNLVRALGRGSDKMRRVLRGCAFAAVVLVLVLATACSGSGYEHDEFFGAASEEELADARAFQSASATVLDVLDPQAPCPETDLESPLEVLVYRFRQGCLWEDQADEVWLTDTDEIDTQRYLDLDPFIVHVWHQSAPGAPVESTAPYLVLAEHEGARCALERTTTFGWRLNRWGALAAAYRNPQTVQAAGWRVFPWHEPIERCPS